VRRSSELAPLSRDHHVALAHALKLRRTTVADLEPVTAAFLAFLAGPGRAHFAQEEEILAPELPADHAELVARMVEEHAEILQRAEWLGRAPDVESARELGGLLSRHVRFEERELFPLAEERLPPARLREIARRLETS
jgi:hypothetical protein